MKKLGLVLTMMGAFVVLVGVLGRFYAYDRLAVIPADAEIDAVAETAPDEPATYFDISTLSEKTAALTNRTKIRGDVRASAEASEEAGRDVVVWTSYACTGPSDEDCLADPLPVSGALESMALDTHESDVVPWGGAYRESGGERDDDPATTSWVYKLPFDVQKRDYKYWNGDVGAAVPLTYEGESTVKGLKVYEFSEDVPPTTVGTIDLPGSLVGSAEATVTGDRVVSPTLQMTVEPETGVAMTITSSPDSWVEVDGEKVLTITRGTLSINDETVTANVDTYKPLSLGLHALRVWVLPVGIVLGLLLIGLGVLAGRRRPRRASRDDHHQAQRATAGV